MNPQSCNGSQQESNPDPSSTATTASPPTATRHQVGTTIPAVRRSHGRLRRAEEVAEVPSWLHASLARRTRRLPPSLSLHSRVTGQHVRARATARRLIRSLNGRKIFFSHNKSINIIFNHDLSVK